MLSCIHTNMLFLKLCNEVVDLITYEDVLQFFINKWAPIVNSLHSSTTGNVVEEFLWMILEVIKELPTNEVRNIFGISR